MSKFLLLAVLALLFADASGVVALVSPEPCTSLTDGLPDGKCPSLCVRCGCGALTTVAVTAPAVRDVEIVTPTRDRYARILTTGSPRDILHVPK